MGFFSTPDKWQANPNAAGIGQQFRDYGNSQTLGMAGKTAKQGLKQFSQGNYDSGIVGNLLAPIRDQFATQSREAARGYGMGALGLAGGVQPGLMARQKQLGEDQIGENMGLALSSAVPQIYGQLSNTFQNAQNSRRGAEEFGLSGQLQAANMGQWMPQKSFMDKLGMIADTASKFASPFLAGGMGGMLSGGAAAGGSGSGAWGAAKGFR